MINLFNRLSNLGINQSTSLMEATRIRLLNKISIFGILIIINYTFLFPLFDFFEPLPFLILSVFLFSSPILFNSAKKYETARYSFLVSTNLIIFIFCFVFGEYFWTQLMYLNCSLTGVLFFNKKWKSLLGFLLSLSFYVFTYYIFETQKPFIEVEELPLSSDIFRGITMITVTVLFYLSIIHFKTEHYNYEEIINVNNDQLASTNEALKQQAEEIKTQSDKIFLQNKDLNYAFSKLNHQNKELTDSLKYASKIQRSILGNSNDSNDIIDEYTDGFIIYKPKDIVSGDFYWFEEIDYYKIMIVADCTGHGVPGAFMTIMGNDFLNDIVIEQQTIIPHKILELMNENVMKSLGSTRGSETQNDGMDMSILIINNETQEIWFAGANMPLYYVQNGEEKVIKGSPYPIGSSQYNNTKVYESHVIPYEFGSKFYLFSDGYQDQFGGPRNKKFMTKKFRELIFKTSNMTMNDQKEYMTEAFINWKKFEEQTDDILVLGIEI